MRGGRLRQPRTDVPIELRFLLVWIVDRHEWSEAVRARVTGRDHEIPWRDVGKKPVLVAQSNDAHSK